MVKMRNRNLTLRLLLIVCPLFILAGCDSFLTPDPVSFTSASQFYETPSDFEKAINGAYAQLRDVVGDVLPPDADGNNYRQMTALRGPNITVHFDVNLPGTVGGMPQINKWKMTVSNPANEAVWMEIYDLVKETNVILGRIGDVTFDDAAHKKRIIGEAKFLRAFAYWNAVQFWGDVPLILEEVSSPKEALPEGRAPAQKVYQQIIADLKDAVANLPVSYSGGDIGRITRGAAKFLLGKTYLLTGNYTDALTAFEALDQEPYDYHLLPNLRAVFDPANKYNAEVVFGVQYNPTISGQPSVGVIAAIVPWNSENELVPSPIVPDGNYMPTPNVIMAFEEGSDRMDASIAWWVKEGNKQYVEIAFGDSLAYLYKFYWPSHITQNGEMTMNWIVFRFADVLLSAAEAAWRLGNSVEALNYLNRVRERAGLPDVDLSEYPGQLTGSPLGDAILQERLLELLGEGHSWFDLKRFGVALEKMKIHSEFMRSRDPKVTGEYKIREYKLLYPIPSRAVILGNLKQNPGWN